MGRERIQAQIHKEDCGGNVGLRIETEDGNVTILNSGVKQCNLVDGQTVWVLFDNEQEQMPRLPPAPNYVWASPCELCKNNPYRAASQEQCVIAKKP